jgi:hypothetical protein
MSKDLLPEFRPEALGPDMSYAGVVGRARAQLELLVGDPAEPGFVLLWREADGMCCSIGQTNTFGAVKDFAVQALYALKEAARLSDRPDTAMAAALAMELLGARVEGEIGGVQLTRRAP